MLYLLKGYGQKTLSDNGGSRSKDALKEET